MRNLAGAVLLHALNVLLLGSGLLLSAGVGVGKASVSMSAARPLWLPLLVAVFSSAVCANRGTGASGAEAATEELLEVQRHELDRLHGRVLQRQVRMER